MSNENVLNIYSEISELTNFSWWNILLCKNKVVGLNDFELITIKSGKFWFISVQWNIDIVEMLY